MAENLKTGIEEIDEILLKGERRELNMILAKPPRRAVQWDQMVLRTKRRCPSVGYGQQGQYQEGHEGAHGASWEGKQSG